MAPQDTRFPVPFSIDDLPETLQSAVEPAIADSLQREEAFHAIEEYWRERGERTAPTLLAYAYLRLTDACEIMVDRQMQEAERAIDLCEEARDRGVADPEAVDEFEGFAREVWQAVKEKRDQWYELSKSDPADVDDELVGTVAHELVEREEYDRAIDFFERKLATAPNERSRTRLRIADCHEKLGREDRAEEIYRELLDRDNVDDQVAGPAYLRWVLLADDDATRERFEEARRWADDADIAWPQTHPSQAKLLDRGLELDDPDMALHAADVIDARDGVVSHELREQVDEARRQYDE